MNESLRTRFKFWLCARLGHRFYPPGTVIQSNRQTWVWNNQLHRSCKRCGRTISTPSPLTPP